MKHPTLALGLLAVALPALSVSAARAGGLKAVVFAMEPVEMPKNAQTQARLKAATDLLRQQMKDKGFTIVDTAPQDKKIAESSPLSQCNGCDQDIAQALGADIEVATAVQQASSAIFNMSGSIKDVKTNRVLRQGVVDIRGESPDVWNHGVKFLLKERLLQPALPDDPKALATAADASK